MLPFYMVILSQECAHIIIGETSNSANIFQIDTDRKSTATVNMVDGWKQDALIHHSPLASVYIQFNLDVSKYLAR